MVLVNMVHAAARRSMGCLLFAFKTVPPRPGKCRISILMRGLQSCCWLAAYFHQLPDGTHKGGGSADAPTPCPIVLRRLENDGGDASQSRRIFGLRNLWSANLSHAM